MRFRGLFFLIGCIILCLGLVGCNNSSIPVTSQQTTELPTINVGYLSTEKHNPLLLAATEREAFKVNYRMYLKPLAEKGMYDFYYDYKKVAQIKMVVSKEAGNLQALMKQGNVEIGILDNKTIIHSMDQGLKAKLLTPFQATDDQGDSMVAIDGFLENNMELAVKFEQLLILAAKHAEGNKDSVVYITEPTQEWINNTRRIAEVDNALGNLQGQLKGLKGKGLENNLFNLEVYKKACKQLKAKKLL